jgi:hypothetical protein
MSRDYVRPDCRMHDNVPELPVSAQNSQKAKRINGTYVPDPRSHELWRETAEERANWRRTAMASQELWPKSLRKLGFLRPTTAAETVRSGHNGGGLETEIQRSPFFAQEFLSASALLPIQAEWVGSIGLLLNRSSYFTQRRQPGQVKAGPASTTAAHSVRSRDRPSRRHRQGVVGLAAGW